MNRKIQPLTWVLVISVIWLSFFAFLFLDYTRKSAELGRVAELRKELENLNFYKRSLASIELELARIRDGEKGPKTPAELVANLPEMAEKAGIKRISIESLPPKRNQPQGVLDLKVSLSGSYREIGSLVQALEKTSVPLQVTGAQFESTGQAIQASLIITIRRAGEATRE